MLSLALALSLALLRVSNASLLKHREVTPQLPEDDNRVRRNPNSGPHTPEQVRKFEMWLYTLFFGSA